MGIKTSKKFTTIYNNLKIKTITFMKKLFLLIIIALQYSFTITAQYFPATQGFASKEDSIRTIEHRKQVIKAWEEGKPEREHQQKKLSVEKAENDFREANERMKTAEVVFEGTLLKYDVYPYYGPNGIEKRTSKIFDVKKVFKGNLKLGTIEMIIKDEGDHISMLAEREHVKIHEIGTIICFARIAKEFTYDPLYNIDKVDNKTIITCYPEKVGFSMDSQSGKWIGNRIIYYLSNETINKTLEFQTKDSLYNYLRKIDDLKIPEKAEKFEPKEEKQPAVTKPANIV